MRARLGDGERLPGAQVLDADLADVEDAVGLAHGALVDGDAQGAGEAHDGHDEAGEDEVDGRVHAGEGGEVVGQQRGDVELDVGRLGEGQAERAEEEEGGLQAVEADADGAVDDEVGDGEERERQVVAQEAQLEAQADGHVGAPHQVRLEGRLVLHAAGVAGRRA